MLLCNFKYGNCIHCIIFGSSGPKGIVSYCHTSASGMHRPSTLENKYSNIFFHKTTRPTVLKFHMEHDLTPGSQNRKIGSGLISKMADVTKIAKITKSTSSPEPLDIFG